MPLQVFTIEYETTFFVTLVILLIPEYIFPNIQFTGRFVNITACMELLVNVLAFNHAWNNRI